MITKKGKFGNSLVKRAGTARYGCIELDDEGYKTNLLFYIFGENDHRPASADIPAIRYSLPRT